MKQGKYYDCHYLLTLKDQNGKLPEIYISDGNRTAGKTVSWKKHMTDKFLRESEDDINQFMMIFRNKYEMYGSSESYFGDIGRLFYKGHEMTERKIAEGLCVQYIMDGQPCGFGVSLSMANKYKRMSSLFVRVCHMFFDEYQDDNGRYLTDEVKLLMNLHTTVARGDGKQTRRVPLYMASNTVSTLNPYYDALGINKRLKRDTKILRGDGWVYERTYNESAMQAFQDSAFNNAFKDNSYYSHASENVYLNDNLALIEKPSGIAKYECSVKYNGEWFSIRKYDTMMYVDEGADFSYPVRICFNVDDVTDDRVVMVGRQNYEVIRLREWFNAGRMRFKNLKCKNMTLDLLAYL